MKICKIKSIFHDWKRNVSYNLLFSKIENLFQEIWRKQVFFSISTWLKFRTESQKNRIFPLAILKSRECAARERESSRVRSSNRQTRRIDFSLSRLHIRRVYKSTVCIGLFQTCTFFSFNSKFIVYEESNFVLTSLTRFLFLFNILLNFQAMID